MTTRITDLEQLVLLVRSDIARSYVAEAVGAYQAGAFRAAILTTWLAVTFDIIDKVREIALTGDPEAQKCVAQFDQIHENDDVTAALLFEKGILDVAKDKFELFGSQDYEDLSRLHKDRNRCAHPSLAVDGVYQPSAELTRYHIHSAVMNLLRFQPVQGKAALNFLVDQVTSDFFPVAEADGLTVLQSGPLNRARESLVRNFAIVLLKDIFFSDTVGKPLQRLRCALRAARQMHRSTIERVLKDKSPELIRKVEDDNLVRALWFVYYFQDCWDLLDEDVKVRMQTYAANLPSAEMANLHRCLTLPFLKESAKLRLQRTNVDEIESAITSASQAVPPEYVDRGVDLLGLAGTYREANRVIAKVLLPIVGTMGPDHVRAVMECVSQNSQARWASNTPPLLHSIHRAHGDPNGEFEAWVDEYHLRDLVPAAQTGSAAAPDPDLDDPE